jgi:hypothetical protein
MQMYSFLIPNVRKQTQTPLDVNRCEKDKNSRQKIGTQRVATPNDRIV